MPIHCHSVNSRDGVGLQAVIEGARPRPVCYWIDSAQKYPANCSQRSAGVFTACGTSNGTTHRLPPLLILSFRVGGRFLQQRADLAPPRCRRRGPSRGFSYQTYRRPALAGRSSTWTVRNRIRRVAATDQLLVNFNWWIAVVRRESARGCAAAVLGRRSWPGPRLFGERGDDRPARSRNCNNAHRATGRALRQRADRILHEKDLSVRSRVRAGLVTALDTI